jgi:lipopolysaccharide heptosyltransferase I
LIVRLSAIGDVIHGMPLACALRRRFPAALLAWVVEERAAALLRGHEALDELITLPQGWLKSPGTVWRLVRRLRAMKFETAIDVQGLTKAAIVAWLSGAGRRIGLGNPWGRELSQWLNTELVDTTAEHAVDRTLQLLLPLGIDPPEVRFQVPELPPDRVAAEEMIRQAGLEGGFAIINPGAGWPSKLWPTERYAAVAGHLGRTWGLPTVVVWAGEKERILAEEVVARSDGHAQVAPPTTLTELAALARRSRLFIGSDTGPLHLAAAVGTPCVGLYGPWPAKRHGPYGPRNIALQKMFFEGPTRARRNAPPKFMEAIHVELVCGACDQILKRDGRHAA